MHMCIIKLSACDVTWDIATTPDEGAGQGEGGFQHCAEMVTSGHSCRKPFVGNGWAMSLLLCTNGLRKQSSGHVGPPLLAVKQPLAKSHDYCKLFRSGCGLSHKSAKDGCNGTRVKLEASNTFNGSRGLK